MEQAALAVAAHPDDIEFMMAGTLILLGRAGYRAHYLNLADGCCGSATLDAAETARVRGAEARQAAALIGAVYHPPLTRDLEIFYGDGLLRRLSAIVREIRPQIVLVQAPEDYMEDHVNSMRLAVTAIFCRGMRNYTTDPPRPPVDDAVALYHALPYGLRNPLRRPMRPDFMVDIGTALADKRRMLACHHSQKEWLDHSQGLDSYLNTMESMAAEVGAQAERAPAEQTLYAEGWRRHLHLGFGAADFDPLGAALAPFIIATPEEA